MALSRDKFSSLAVPAPTEALENLSQPRRIISKLDRLYVIAIPKLELSTLSHLSL